MIDKNPSEIIADAELPGMVTDSSVESLPNGYQYGVTRYADLILRDAFPQRWQDLMGNLEDYHIEESDIIAGGGGRAKHTKRHDQGLYDRGWHKHNVVIEKLVDGKAIYKVRGHEIDVYAMGEHDDYPGIAVEMEWNNKDPFYHRDLNNFSVLHREGVIAVGFIVTRGPRLQQWLESLALQGFVEKSKYGKSTTHWDKLIPMVNLGGGGECPLFLVGIEPERVDWPDGFKNPES